MGSSVGCAMGASVGCSVGCAMGAVVGCSDGLAGCSVGAKGTVGSGVGTDVGLRVSVIGISPSVSESPRFEVRSFRKLVVDSSELLLLELFLAAHGPDNDITANSKNKNLAADPILKINNL